MSRHSPALWTGSGKRSVQARDTSKAAAQPEPVAAPETGTSVEVEKPSTSSTGSDPKDTSASTSSTGSEKTDSKSKGSAKTGS